MSAIKGWGGFFRYGRLYFLDQKTSIFQNLWCVHNPHGHLDKGGWASADNGGWGQIFAV